MGNIVEKTVPIQPLARPASLDPWPIHRYSTRLPSKAPTPGSRSLWVPCSTGREDGERSWAVPLLGSRWLHKPGVLCSRPLVSLSALASTLWSAKETQLSLQALCFHICSQFPPRREDEALKNPESHQGPALPFFLHLLSCGPVCVKWGNKGI